MISFLNVIESGLQIARVYIICKIIRKRRAANFFPSGYGYDVGEDDE